MSKELSRRFEMKKYILTALLILFSVEFAFSIELCYSCHEGVRQKFEVSKYNQHNNSELVTVFAKSSEIFCYNCHVPTLKNETHNTKLEPTFESQIGSCLFCHGEQYMDKNINHVVGFETETKYLPSYYGIVTCHTCHSTHGSNVNKYMTWYDFEFTGELCIICHTEFK
jgi:predicted CXXCH cytochrome family protein